MEIQEMFLVFGEKCQELQESGNDCFFNYSGHVNLYHFQVYAGKWEAFKNAVIDETLMDTGNAAEFVEKCFHAANLLMHRPESFGVKSSEKFRS